MTASEHTTPDLTVTMQVVTVDGTEDVVLTGNDAMEWRAELARFTDDRDVIAVVVYNAAGRPIGGWAQ